MLEWMERDELIKHFVSAKIQSISLVSDECSHSTHFWYMIIFASSPKLEKNYQDELNLTALLKCLYINVGSQRKIEPRYAYVTYQ